MGRGRTDATVVGESGPACAPVDTSLRIDLQGMARASSDARLRRGDPAAGAGQV